MILFISLVFESAFEKYFIWIMCFFNMMCRAFAQSTAVTWQSLGKKRWPQQRPQGSQT